MKTAAQMSTLSALLRQVCPRCRAARIFRRSIFTGFPRMWGCCPNCGLKFEREQGYFLGAMYISYGLALITNRCHRPTVVVGHFVVSTENNSVGNFAVL